MTDKKVAITDVKAGYVVGKVPKVVKDALDILTRQETAAWHTLETIIKDKRDLWTRLREDYNLPDNYNYVINNNTLEIEALRR